MPTKIVFGTTASEVIYGGNERDPFVLYDEIFFGGGGADTVYAGDGNDWVWASAGDASSVAFFGGNGNDVLIGFEGNDALSGDAGDDVLIANGGQDALYGGAGDDQLWAGAGADVLVGGVGADLLVGGDGNDTLVAGVDSVRDVMIGDSGADNYIVGAGGESAGYSFIYQPVPTPSAAGVNIIWGFELGTDVLTLPTANNSLPGRELYGKNYISNYDYNQELGLTGTLIQVDARRALGGFGFINDWVFLAGTQTSIAGMQSVNSLAFNDAALTL